MISISVAYFIYTGAQKKTRTTLVHSFHAFFIPGHHILPDFMTLVPAPNEEYKAYSLLHNFLQSLLSSSFLCLSVPLRVLFSNTSVRALPQFTKCQNGRSI
jgi:zinc transporter ZupT